MVRIEHVLESWKAVRTDTAQAVEDFPAAALPFEPIAGVDGFVEVARHILNSGHVITGILLSGTEDFAPAFRSGLQTYAYPLPAAADKNALAQALRESVEQRCAELALAKPEWWARMIARWDGERMTRLELLQFVKEHELTHRSQLFLYLRMQGIVPATTRRRRARQQAEQAG